MMQTFHGKMSTRFEHLSFGLVFRSLYPEALSYPDQQTWVVVVVAIDSPLYTPVSSPRFTWLW